MVTTWHILYEMFGKTPAWLHGQSTKKEKNGRKLFRLLFDHYLGAEHVTHQANQVEARIASLSYKGEQRNWTWDKYVDAHIEQHIIAKNLMPYGYSGIDERSKVRHLLGGISDPGLAPVSCNILAMREEDKTFTKCATMYTDFIRMSNPAGPRQDRAAKFRRYIPDGAAAVDAEGVEGETDADAGAEAHVAPACRTRQTSTRSLGLRPSTTLPRTTPTSMLQRRRRSTRTVKMIRRSLPSARLPRFAGATTPWTSQTTGKVCLAMTTTADPMPRTLRSPANRERSPRTDRPWLTGNPDGLPRAAHCALDTTIS